MKKIRRDDFVNTSYLTFLLFLGGSVVIFIVGIACLFLYFENIELEKYIFKLVCMEFILVFLTIIMRRAYLRDSELLHSTKDKFMKIREPAHIQINGGSGEGDFGGGCGD